MRLQVQTPNLYLRSFFEARGCSGGIHDDIYIVRKKDPAVGYGLEPRRIVHRLGDSLEKSEGYNVPILSVGVAMEEEF